MTDRLCAKKVNNNFYSLFWDFIKGSTTNDNCGQYFNSDYLELSIKPNID